MMILRTMMLRRRTDPKTRTHTLCEPARSKCTWTFDKSHFVQEFTGKMPQTNWIPRPRPALCASPRNRNTFWDVIFYRKNAGSKTATHTLREPAQNQNAFHKSHFIREFTGKMPEPKTATHTLCEPAQSKCTWTFHNSHFT